MMGKKPAMGTTADQEPALRFDHTMFDENLGKHILDSSASEGRHNLAQQGK